jgi:Concanavalin A-like lectin/glucanases superfamily/Domain of unknown function (DUF2341)
MNQRTFVPSLLLAMIAGISAGSACSSDDGTAPRGNSGAGGSTSGGGSDGSGGVPGSGGADTGGAPGSGGADTGSGGGDTGSGGTSTGSGGGDSPDGGSAGSPPLGDAGGTDLAKWQYFKTLDLDTTSSGANVSGDVPKYPVPVVLSAANFDFSQAKPDGADLRFSTLDGTPLPYAIESWDAATKVAALWVKVDVKGNQKAEILMSWGNTAAASTGDSHAVFATADGFVGVWHLAETGSTTPGAYKDATANAADATGIAMAATSVGDGRVGKAAVLVHDQKQYIHVEGTEKNKLFDIFNQMTFSIWVKPKTHTVEYQCMFSKGEGGFRIHFYGAADWDENKGKNITEICVESAGDLCSVNPGGGTDVAPDKWFHLVGVTDHPKSTYYINGAQEAQETDSGGWKSDASKPVSIGNNSSALGRSFDGTLDEARIMNVPKDTNWIKLEYESAREGQKFVTAGQIQKRF